MPRCRQAVLCEKPLGLNQGEVLDLYGTAARRDVLLVEALMYLMHPRMHLAKQLIDDGAIGAITGFSSSFGFAFPFRLSTGCTILTAPVAAFSISAFIHSPRRAISSANPMG